MQQETNTENDIKEENSNAVTFEFAWKWCRLRYYLVEPMVLLLVFGYNLSGTILKNQIIFQTCTNIFGYNATDCHKLSTKNATDYIKNIETEVQLYVSNIFLTTSLIQSIVPACCGAFVGAWSDRFGRKPLLIASFTGYFLYYSIIALISYLSNTINLSPWYYLMACIPLSLLGDSVTYSVATLCYISDVSSLKEKPFRMTLYEAFIYIGLMAGSFAAGHLYENFNSSTLIFVISSVVLLFATLIIVLCVPESLNLQASATSQAEDQTMETENKFKKLFDFKLLKDLYATCFKRRDFSDRSVILLTIGCLITCAFVVDGSSTVFYLFIREKFQWTVKEFTTYETISILVPILGNILGIWLLRKIFKLKLLNVALISLFSQTCSSIMKAFAAINWQIYLAIVLGIFKSIGNPMLRTVIANLVPANELGKIFSFYSCLQAFVPFLASPIYTIAYKSTIESFPGSFNILSAILYLLAISFVLVILCKQRNFANHYNRF